MDGEHCRDEGMESSSGHDYSLSESEMDEVFSEEPVINSSVTDLSDEEISTKKENHWRLGPEDLNDTLVYDFELGR
ncbi:hypothetical protein AMEX_G7782 [Astyanax mexicanus]|uniref:Uncharacterized protein n=1 Tax=Astyanax mexicanus TaxID=7994 RepID=A0A8T2M0C1_ASTMX|nr:hypothetical protein AMEX_G7782 [Astyanax mexicanus]